MGYIGIIGAIGSLVASGVSAGVSASNSGGGGAPSVNLSGVQLPNPNNAGLGAFLGQGVMWPQLMGFTNQINQQDTTSFTNLLKTLYPGATSQLGQISNLASGYLSGALPQDVQNQISRATAQQALSGGYPGTGLAANAQGQNIGINSVALTQLGANMAQTGVGIAKGMMPGYVNPAQLLFSPSQLLQRTDQATYYNADVQNQQQIVNAQLAMQLQALAAAQSQSGGSSGGIGGLSSLFGGGSSGGGIGSLFGGGSGGLGGIFSGGGGPGYNIPTSSSAPVGVSLGPGD